MSDEEKKHPHLLKIITNNRDWILQCHSANDRKEWMNALISSIQDAKNNGYVPEYCDYHRNLLESELLVYDMLRNSFDNES